jgi:hypothetical protein
LPESVDANPANQEIELLGRHAFQLWGTLTVISVALSIGMCAATNFWFY